MIYLDNASTTKIDKRVLDAMLPYLTDKYGNPGNSHSLGREAKEALTKARIQVATMIGAKPENIIFTSGGSEANTMVFRGMRNFFFDEDLYGVATSNVEHKSILRAADAMYNRWDIPVNQDGIVSLDAVQMIDNEYDDIALVSVMHTNNETGSVNDVKRIAKYCRERGIVFHTDCVQAAGFHKLDVEEIGCDFMSLSSHKIHGPKGVGALYVRDPDFFFPTIYGGDAQEFGLRGGTENVAGIVGFGKACSLVTENISQDHAHMADLCRKLQENLLKIQSSHGGLIAKINGRTDIDKRILNVCFSGVDAETVLILLDSQGIEVSAGAACNNNESIPSYVLKAMGLSDEDAMNSIRISLSRDTSEEEIEYASQIISKCVGILAP